MNHFLWSSANFLASWVVMVSSDPAVSNVTTSDSTLQTWWHDNGEINYETPVKENNVRQSHIYSAWAMSTTAATAE